MASIIVSLIGVVLVMQPWMQLNRTGNESAFMHEINSTGNHLDCLPHLNSTGSACNFSSTPMPRSTQNDAKNIFLGYLLSGVAGIASSGRVTVQKKYSKNLDPDILTLYSGSGSIIISIIIMFVFEKPKWPNNTLDCIWLMVHSLTVGLGAVIAYRAQLKIPQTLYGLASSTFVVFALLGQYTLLRHIDPGYQNASEIIGVILVTLSVLMPFLKVPNCFTGKSRYEYDAEEEKLVTSDRSDIEKPGKIN